ncbi:glycosyltransferase [Luteolibacter yonseiensis]|uniref:Glycosyltransferase n=1 Tax=Luteolibacter yonseiensis TaxID=1144680 RepID=A0A934R0D2_9BACT|nr:glycosyltransferase [Luteolibacter yonseiensis]MBK1814407.1 glycosyltransferase [Luteolibacter yonseiensis]
MKILQVFNQYRFRGGEEAWVDGIPDLLASSATVDELRFRTDDWIEGAGPSPLKQVFLMADNPDSRAQLRAHARRFAPDVLLFHNVIPVGSFGLYQEARGLGIPVMQYTHNFRPFSPGGTLWTGTKVNDAALHGNPLPEIISGAWQDSRLKTAVLSLHLKLAISRGLLDCVDRWIAPSRFMKDKFMEAGIPAGKIELLRHCWDAGQEPLVGNEKPYYLYLGRLVSEKGVLNLVEAWEILEDKLGPRCPGLVIAGTGPEERHLLERAGRLKNVRCVGFVGGTEKQDLLNRCRALLVPSIWWEPLGLTAYEAYAAGRPVIGARSGALTETIADGVTGWSHSPGDPADLARVIIAAEDAGAAVRAARGQAGRQWLKEQAGPGEWRDHFLRICEEIVAETDGRRHEASPGHAVRPKDKLTVTTYLADQNPGHDRSFGISRMSQVVLEALQKNDELDITTIASRTSQQAPENVNSIRILPWGTRKKWVRLLTDHFHPLFNRIRTEPDIYYYPKGYLPLLSPFCSPSVVTIHDTIIQYDKDRYPEWRRPWEYRYWTIMLKHTLKSADCILTVSESSKTQISEFMKRHQIPAKEISVTYEPCLYEEVPQPLSPAKGNYVIHLASCEPHKRTAQLIRWWKEAESQGMELPMLHLIGPLPPEASHLLDDSRTIIKRPFLEDDALQAAYLGARALILPSEIEGFGLPALEAYYLGTPVCFVSGTSVEEILGVTTHKGAFSLDSRASLFTALDEVMSMTADEIRDCGLKLRKAYATDAVVEKMVTAFRRYRTS